MHRPADAAECVSYLVLLGDGVERGEELLKELPAAPAADRLDVLSCTGKELD